MTNKNRVGKPIDPKYQLFHEYAEKILRADPTTKSSEVISKIESIKKRKLETESYLSEEDFQIPKNKQPFKIISNYREKFNSDYYLNLTEYFSPISTWSNSYWESAVAPYNFNDDEKILLNDIYNQLDIVWFGAMSTVGHGRVAPRITMAQAMWICILCKINPKLKSTAVDVWMMSQYFASSYIQALTNKSVAPGNNPIEAVDESALKYIEKQPYASLENAEAYHQAINNNFIRPVASTWSELESEYTEGIRSNREDYVLDYPMLYASQLGSAWYMPRYQSVACIMATMVIQIINAMEHKEAKNGQLKYCLMEDCKSVIKKFSTTKGEWIGRRSLDQWNSGTDLKFPIASIDLYYPLMKSLLRLEATNGNSKDMLMLPNTEYFPPWYKSQTTYHINLHRSETWDINEVEVTSEVADDVGRQRRINLNRRGVKYLSLLEELGKPSMFHT